MSVRLTGQDWLTAPATRAVMAALEPDKSSRIGPGNVTGRAPTSRSAEQVAPVLSGHR